ncbi:hypothetical protein [Marinisporobacter balticus]|nr:hypothetical protein [Marinisporobacter balticus]
MVLILYLLRNRKVKSIEDEDEEERFHILFTDRFSIERDTRIVPLEETLLMNDTKIKRHQLLDAMKRDSSGYINIFKIALRDEDVETSHYAASAIDKIKREFDLKLQQFSVAYEKNKTDEKLSKEYSQFLDEYINSNLLDEDEYEYKIIMGIHIQVIENILKITEDKDKYYKKIIDILFKIKDLERARKYCEEFIENYKTEDAYMVNLRYYFLIKDKENFKKCFENLLKSSIKLSNKGLEIIRFWLGAS